jgi:hypothetical protein
MFGSPVFWPIFVRRTATVTICAPLASMARAVCCMSLYLPVPTKSRDVKLRPATVKLSEFLVGSDMGGLAFIGAGYRCVNERVRACQ